MESRMSLIMCALAVCFQGGCQSKPPLQTATTSPIAPLHVSFIPVEDPICQLCTDDTLSRTEWFNVPVVRFSGGAIDLFGRTTTARDLQDWAKEYYEHKVERGLWVQIAPADVENAERALLPLVRMFPDLQVRRVDFGFSCPKTHR
jgi:hypothetical protein